MTPDIQPSATLTVDDPDNGGSEPGAWRDAIRDTPGLNPVEHDASQPDSEDA